MPPLGMSAFELVQLPALRTTAFELIQKPPLWTTAIELSKSRRSRRRQLTSSKAAVDVAGFRMIQKPAFVLPAIRSISGFILDPILILFFLKKNTVFPYKTPLTARRINPFNLDLNLPTFNISEPQKHVLQDSAIVPNTVRLRLFFSLNAE